MATGAKGRPVRTMSRQNVSDLEGFLKRLDELLGDIPVYVDHATFTISAAEVTGPGDEMGTVEVTYDFENDEVHTAFKPYGGTA
jgi:hypothetical protein